MHIVPWRTLHIFVPRTWTSSCGRGLALMLFELDIFRFVSYLLFFCVLFCFVLLVSLLLFGFFFLRCYSKMEVWILFVCLLSSAICIVVGLVFFVWCCKSEWNSLWLLFYCLWVSMCGDQMVSFDFKHETHCQHHHQFPFRSSFGKLKIPTKPTSKPPLSRLTLSHPHFHSIAFVFVGQDDGLPSFPPSASYFNHKSRFKQ